MLILLFCGAYLAGLLLIHFCGSCALQRIIKRFVMASIGVGALTPHLEWEDLEIGPLESGNGW